MVKLYQEECFDGNTELDEENFELNKKILNSRICDLKVPTLTCNNGYCIYSFLSIQASVCGLYRYWLFTISTIICNSKYTKGIFSERPFMHAPFIPGGHTVGGCVVQIPPRSAVKRQIMTDLNLQICKLNTRHFIKILLCQSSQSQ